MLHVIPSVGPRRGGPSLAMDLIARSLVEQGIQVDVATTDDDDDQRLPVPLHQPVQRAGATYRFFPRQLHAYTTSLPLRSWLHAHAHEYDLIHTHAVFSFAPTVAARAAQRAHVPYVVRPLGTLAPYGLRQHGVLKRLSLRFVDRPILRHAAVIHCTSDAEAAEIAQLDPAWRTRVIPLGLELERISPARDKQWLHSHAPQLADRMVVLFLSRIDPKKGVELVLSAIARLRHDALPVGAIIAGAGAAEYVQQLKSQADRLGISNDIIWSGQVAGADKMAVLAAADAFVLPSRAENFGIAVAEALAAALPVIISSEVGIHPQIRASGAGLVVETNEAAVAGAINKLMNEEQRRRMSGLARPLAEQHYSSKVMGSRLADLYREVVGRNVHPRH